MSAPRKNPILPGFLEKVEQFCSDYEVKSKSVGYRHEIHTIDPNGSRDILLEVDASNSKRTVGIHGGSIRVYLREWDVAKARSIAIWSLVHSNEPKSHQTILYKELGQYHGKMPNIVEMLVTELHQAYIKEMGGDDYQRRVNEIKKLLDQIKDLVSEDDVLQWYREAHVKKVMES